MRNLVEFLTARLDEDEAVAREVQEKVRPEPIYPGGPTSVRYYEHADGSTPGIIWDVDYAQGGYTISAARVLAEIEAKRRIIHEHIDGEAWCDYCAGGPAGDADLCVTLQLLASVYADHPDYDEAWRV